METVELVGSCIFVVVVIVLGIIIWLTLVQKKQDDGMNWLGVTDSHPLDTCLPKQTIEAYEKLKADMQQQYGRENHSDDGWMSELPPGAKENMKRSLMTRAIQDMSALKRIDEDARGYWRLFCKGHITRTFWNSVVNLEKELSEELEEVKHEAQSLEPKQDPQAIIQEAMHFIMKYGDKLPSDLMSSVDAVNEMMRQLPIPPGMPGLPPGAGIPPGMPGLPPGMPGMPPAMQPPPGAVHMGAPPAQQQVGDGEADCNWTQNAEEVEVTINVSAKAKKGDIKVVFQPQVLKVAVQGDSVAEGKLAGCIMPDDCTWTLSAGKLVITLGKADQRPWPLLFKT